MSLIAWYPLNGDTKDYSGNNFHLTNNGATVDASGKIGSCYNFVSLKPMKYTGWILPQGTIWKDFTVSAWIYPTETPTQHGYNVLSFGGNAMIRFRLTTNNLLWVLWGGDTGSNYTSCESNGKIPLNTWTHVACRLNNGIMSLYINGRLDKTHNIQKDIKIVWNNLYVGGYGSATDESWRGKLNDVRIYNEALTAKQIKEISQAKICHYTFNENIQPIKNLCKQYPVKTKNWNSNIYPGTIFGEDEIGKYFIKQSTSYAYHGIGFDIPIQIGKYYTVSYELWCEKAFNIVYDYNIVCNNISGNDAPRAEEAILLGLAYDTPKRWKKFAMRSKAKDEAINPRLQDVIAGYSPTNQDMVGTKIYYRNVMVEEKDRETTYVEDSKSIVLKDVSNFNDLNITENQAHSFPAYKENSFKFSSYSEINSNIELSTNNIGSDSQLTTVSWIKPITIPTVGGIGLIYGRANFQGFGLGFGYKDENNIAIYAYHRLSGGAKNTPFKWIKINEWVQVACVLDNVSSKLKLFINGQKACEVESSTGEFTNSKKTFMFGGLHYPWGNGPWVNFEGHIKDFRMYATALSDEDIRLLYQPEINIDKSNVIRCSGLNEDKINDNTGFYKNASIAYNEFNEIPNIKSGVRNLKLGNEILPVLIDMDKDGGRWARVFYHNCRSGTVLFSGDNSYAEAKETNKNAPTTSDKYSILSKLEHFRPNTKSAFEFRLKYPTDTNDCNIWKQTSNPTYQKVTGYQPIKVDWTVAYWGGLEYSGRQECLADGSANNVSWYYAIGATAKFENGMPSSQNIKPNGSTANDVELWARINNYDLFADNLISNVSISRDGVLTAKEFREI